MTNLTINQADQLANQNETLSTATNNIANMKALRNNVVKAVINDLLDVANDNKNMFDNKKLAIASFIKQNLSDKTIDTYTKRAIKIAKSILIDNYKIKLELLTISQMEKLTQNNKNSVNQMMQLNDELYIDAVKNLINDCKVEKTVKVYSARVAKSKRD